MVRGPLQARIQYWTTQGYRVVSETDRSAQLVRPRHFNPAEFIAMPIYLIEYLGQRDRQVYLAVDETGSVTETGSGLEQTRYRELQARGAGFRLTLVVAVVAVALVVLYLVNAATR